MDTTLRISVIGLGYVGLPLAVGLSRHFTVTGFDIDPKRISALRQGDDRTGEISADQLSQSSLQLTDDVASLAGTDVFIVTVPTPVDEHNVPDLEPLRSASRSVASVIGKGAIVVFESTVYPGVTEETCGVEIENASGLRCGEDFFLGYSPERINPGDREHTVERITKVLAGQTPETTKTLELIYGKLTNGNTFTARDIRTAEAAKVIENAQRDINIAFVNEVATIFQKLGLSVYDVLEAARTKWNFLPFSPGLVGGHCIGVDPYYLAHAAVSIGHHPEIILAGRRLNDSMGGYIAECVARELARIGRGAGARVLVLGLTFKENVPDLRNSRVIDIIRSLRGRGFVVDVHDPHADPGEAQTFYDVELVNELSGASKYDGIVGAVPHAEYVAMTAGQVSDLLVDGGLLADVKGMWRQVEFPPTVTRWQL